MYQHFFKRLLDILLSATLLICLSPLYLIVFIYVIVTMGWPPIFAQMRIGKDEKPFKLYKFRSMTNKRDASGELLPESQRLTPAGLFLRNTSLDELPELWCILTGKMSFVGPRPMPTYYGPYFLPKERKRHRVRGGLIPPESLLGKSHTTYEEQFTCECEYVNKISFVTDFKIILYTFKLVFIRAKDNQGECSRPHLNVYRKNIELTQQ